MRALAAWTLVAIQPALAAQVFRTSVDAVVVEVTVMDGDRPVRGLERRDFEVKDRNITQDIAGVDSYFAPLDITILTEVSAGIGRVRGRTDELVGDTKGLLHQDDTLTSLEFDEQVRHQLDIGPPVGANNALFDAIALAAMQPVASDRRHVVVVITTGRDRGSLLSLNTRLAILRRTEAVVHVITTTRTSHSPAALPEISNVFERRLIDGFEPFLRQVTETTGGLRFPHIADREIGKELATAVESSRIRYRLHYTPRGVTGPGWHAVDVRVKGKSSYSVRARSGYWAH